MNECQTSPVSGKNTFYINPECSKNTRQYLFVIHVCKIIINVTFDLDV